MQNGLLRGVLRRQPAAPGRRARVGVAASSAAASRSASMPLLTLARRRSLVVLALNQLFYRTALGRAFRATSDDPETAQLDGHRQPPHLRARHGARAWPSPRSPRFFSAPAPTSIRHRAGAAALCLRGGDHRRARQPVGHARRRHGPRRRADGRRAINPEWQILAGHLAFLVVLVVRPRGLFPRATD